jgi:hypothetical protein
MIPFERWVRPALPPAAGLLVFLGERPLSPTPARWPLTVLGLAALAGALALAARYWWAARRRKPAVAGVWARAGAPLALFALAALAYLAALPLTGGAGHLSAARALQFGAALGLLMGAVLEVFVELALWGQGDGAIDAGRVTRATAAGTNLALLAALVATIVFALSRTSLQWDVAYFKTTEPSQATRDAVAAMEHPVQAALFFPSDNAVGRLVEDYFQALNRKPSERFKVAVYDAELSPREAAEFKAPGNGTLVFKRDDQIKPMQFGLLLDRARPQLRKLDGDVLAALLELSQAPRIAYFTVGHGERNEMTAEQANGDAGLARFENLLRGRGFTIKPLGLAQGLGRAVPDDAGLLVIAGPGGAFAPGEGEAVRRYLQRGGRVLAFIEPRRGQENMRQDPLLKVLEGYGIGYESVLQANERFFAHRTFTPADRMLLVTNVYGQHPVTGSVQRMPAQNPMAVMTSGALRKGNPPQGLAVQDIVKTMPGTWGDKNGNFRFDPPQETQAEVALALAVGPAGAAADKSKLPILLVFADCDVASNLLLQIRTNATLLADAASWLSGQEAPSGLPKTEEDQPILHAQGDDWVWFYLPIAGVPALVLLLGFLAVGRLRRLARRAA